VPLLRGPAPLRVVRLWHVPRAVIRLPRACWRVELAQREVAVRGGAPLQKKSAFRLRRMRTRIRDDATRGGEGALVPLLRGPTPLRVVRLWHVPRAVIRLPRACWRVELAQREVAVRGGALLPSRGLVRLRRMRTRIRGDRRQRGERELVRVLRGPAALLRGARLCELPRAVVRDPPARRTVELAEREVAVRGGAALRLQSVVRLRPVRPHI